MTRVLLIGPHPDDVEFGAGGLVAGLATLDGAEPHIACFRPGPELPGDPHDPAVAERRCSEAAEAAATLGASLSWLPACRLDQGPLAVRELVGLLRAVQPAWVITVDPDDAHPFHRSVAAWTGEAVFCSALPSVTPSMAALPSPPQLWYMEAYTTVRFEPDLYLDVTQWFAAARRALLLHATGTSITPGLEHQMRAAHLRHGCTAAVPFAEGLRASRDFGQAWVAARTPVLELIARLNQRAAQPRQVEEAAIR